MKRTAVIIGVLALVMGCSSGSRKSGKAAGAGAAKKTAGTTQKKGQKANKNAQKKGAAMAQKKTQDKEAQRRQHVAKELALFDEKEMVFDAAKLPDRDKNFLRHMIKAAQLVEIINKLQINPKDLDYENHILRHGTANDKKLMYRYQMPWCITDESPLCNADSRFPEKRIGWYHWPKGMNKDMLEAIKKAPNAKELLSPFTLVRKEGDKFKAVAFVDDPLFGRHVKALARELREAAKFADTKELATFLEKRAAAFESHDPFPYDDSDYDWIRLKSKWEVTVGPYEVYHNPFNIKARFQMYIGLENTKVTPLLAKYVSRLQDMENLLVKLVGKKVYKGRKLKTDIMVRAIDVIMAAGDGRGSQGSTVAYHLPNRGKSVDEGLYKKVMLINIMDAFSPVVKRRADLVLDPALEKYLTSEADALDVTFHEFSHGFGAYKELPITDVKGRKTTVGEALREYATMMEELKADVLGLWLVAYQLKNKEITEEQAKARYVSQVMHAIGLMQYPLSNTYSRMSSIQLYNYMKEGAVKYVNGRWTVDFAKMPAAVEKLARKVATLQLTGDYEGTAKFVAEVVQKGKDGKWHLVGPISEPAKQTSAKLKAAKVKSLVFSWKVRGLDGAAAKPAPAKPAAKPAKPAKPAAKPAAKKPAK